MSLSYKETMGMIIVSFILGFLQSMVFKRSFTPLPLCVYSGIECLIPNCIKNRHDFIKVA